MTVGRSLRDVIRKELIQDEAEGLRRRRRVVKRILPGRVVVHGCELVDVSSNDYLGLACHPRVRDAATLAIRDYGWGAGASPLVSGYSELHAELERALAEFEQTQAAVVFSSGFAANVGVLSALAGPADAIFADRRNHASLIDGCRLSRARVHVYSGLESGALEAALERCGPCRRKLIVTDSVFSMDGDVAPLDELTVLAERYDAILYIDEAHATGIVGASGRGAAEHFGVCHKIEFRMGTLSKALGSAGGFLVCSRETAEWLTRHARPYVFSTALPSAAAAAALAALEIVRGEPYRRRHVLELADRLRSGLRDLGYDIGLSCGTAIVPAIVGDPEQALDLSEHLSRAGFWSVAIRPPSVPKGTSRLRLSLSADHEIQDVDRLLDALSRWRGRAQPSV